MPPDSTWARIALIPGVRRKEKPTPAWLSAASAAATIACASSTEGASGFSQMTCLPAASSASTTGRCSSLAIATETTSMSSASTMACHDVSARW